MRILFSALVLMFTLLLTGCVEKVTAPFGPPVNRDEESFAEFRDVPFPATFSFSKNESFTYERRGMQSGLVVVSGRMTVDELGAYFDAHLPGYGWSPQADIQYSTALVSTWKKGDKTLTIVGRPSTIAKLVGEITVQLWVAPPYTESDLGSRVIYQKQDSGGGLRGLWPGSTKSSTETSPSGVSEEDI